MSFRSYRRVFLWCIGTLIITLAVFNTTSPESMTRINHSVIESIAVPRDKGHSKGDDNGYVPHARGHTLSPESGHVDLARGLQDETTAASFAETTSAVSTPPLESVTTHNFRRRYVLPIKTRMGGGSNSQFEKFKKAVVFSLLTNSTLVMPPFFLHGGHVLGFTSDHIRPFNETFDVDFLAELLPVATVEHFKDICTKHNTIVTGWNVTSINYNHTSRFLYGNIIGIELPSDDALINFDFGCSLDDILLTLRNKRCVALSMDSVLGINIPNEKREQMLTTVSEHLSRSPKIKHAVDHISGTICPEERYLAFHWRNKSTEGPCFFGREHRDDECATAKKVVRELADLAADAVSDLMKREHIKCIYVACPLWSLEIVDVLSERLPRKNIYISEDLYISPNYKPLLDDYYTLSLVEQEIAYRAAIFVAAGYSNWSDFVSEGRKAIGRTNYNIRELAKIPDDVDKMMI
ncbi:uncharacterized protein [Ptychodera flava]|uniref:uncharacterized protein n=1 Tax=Ptychodera flava TaxID=63121 RepID=UPI00396A3B12